MYNIKNGRLSVSIAEPGKENVTSRFDRAGFITQVRLDDTYDFMGEEDLHDGSATSGGAGLCSEILFDPMSETVSVGEQFPKLGVGNLTKAEDAPYFFMNTYESEDYEITTDCAEDSISFHTAPKAVGGYAVSQDKTISLEDNSLVVSYTMKNEGEKEISFEEYCHNFISMNHKRVNRDYYLLIPCLKLPYGEIKTAKTSGYIYSDGTGMSKTEPSNLYALYEFSKEQIGKAKNFGWRMLDRGEGLCVTEQDDFQVSRVTVWTCNDVMSPEMFFRATLAPGESVSWKRTYTFSVDKETNNGYPNPAGLDDGTLLRVLKHEFLTEKNENIKKHKLMELLGIIKESTMMIPTVAIMTDEAFDEFINGKPGESYTGKGMRVSPNLYKASDGSLWLPILSSMSETAGNEVLAKSLQRIPSMSCLAIAHKMKGVKGLVLDPYTEAMAIPFSVADVMPLLERS